MARTAAPSVAVIDYGIGNLRSAVKALERVGANAELTSKPATITAADAVVLPGVGNFGRCMQALAENELVDVTMQAAQSDTPFLGICVGMQMLFESSDESPDQPGLGVLPGKVELLPDTVKRPQMQWNTVSVAAPDVPAGVRRLEGEWLYFVHSYAVLDSPACLATCDYGGDVVAVAGADNLLATQFHPEKSGQVGVRFLNDFIDSIEA